MKKLNFAVIGCGRFGYKRISAINKVEEANLICVADINRTIAEKVAKEFNIGYHTNIQEVIQRKDVDSIIVAVPNKFHSEIAIKALENGKHVICEKPLAKTLQEARRMVNIAQNNGVFLKTGSNHRYFPSILKAKELIDKDAIGDILRLRGQIGINGEKIKNTWFWNQDLAGGGTFLDNGHHLLDISRWFMGEFAEASGYVLNKYWPISNVEDYGIGFFKTANNCIAVVESSWTLWPEYISIELYGTRGFIQIHSGSSNKVAVGKRRGEIEMAYNFNNIPHNANELELKDFIKSIHEKEQPTPSGYDGFKVVQMVHAVYESSKTGKSVKL